MKNQNFRKIKFLGISYWLCKSLIFLRFSAGFVYSYSVPMHLFSTESCKTLPVKCANISDINCKKTGYRTIDGSCNNLFNPGLGKSYTRYNRVLPSNYGDKIQSMPVSITGNQLPSARLLSFTVFGRKQIPSQRFTLINMQWGQVVAHDMTLRAPVSFAGLKPLPAKVLECCNTTGGYEIVNTTERCFAIPVPENDPYYINYKCISFERTATDKDERCPGTEGPTPVEQLNGVTHYLDLSLVYGSTDQESKSLRAFKGGLLKFEHRGGQMWPPLTRDISDYCQGGDPGQICYKVGDIRGNQNLGLVINQIIFLREHNRIAEKLAQINPHYDDETLFQQARKINIGTFQRINYYEWNPIFYGTQRLLQYRLIYNTSNGEHISDYSPCADGSQIQSFSHVAYRFFHNEVVGELQLIRESREVENTALLLSDYFFKPGIIEKGCIFDLLARGLGTQPDAKTDKNYDTAIAEHLLGGSNGHGRDLRSIDIQRNRDHGLPPYNDYREYCGLPRATSWNGYLDYISKDDVEQLKSIYESYEDVDLTIGGALENFVEDALMGPTFLCINLIQIYRTRVGDRLFFENNNDEAGFTSEQLIEIHKATVARLLCDNTDITHMQPMGFKLISEENQLTRCTQLPLVDLNKWKDTKSRV